MDLPVPSPPSKATNSPRPGRRGWASIGCSRGGSAGGWSGGSRPVHGTGRVRRSPAAAAPTVGAVTTSWDPVTYLRWAGERARPFADLLARVDAADPRVVVDLGCGEGALTASLAARWPRARVTGVDSSPEMLAAAAAHAVDGRVGFVRGDVRDWRPDGPVDVVVSNAVLHWVPGHADLLARWAGHLAPGGCLAVQVPGNHRAPTHRLLADLCTSPGWAGRLTPAAPPPDPVLDPAGYLDVLAGAGLRPDVWETTYSHVLRGPDPVLTWVRGTVLRPVLALLGDDDAAAFTAEYAAALREAYPVRPDGTTVLPFRRVFAVGSRPESS